MNDLPDLERVRRDAITHHEALLAADMMNKVALAEYRCQMGCSLLRVWQTPSGPEFYAQTKHAEPLHTLTGGYIDVRGKDRNRAGLPLFGIPDVWAGLLSDHPSEGWVPLICDHHQGAIQIVDIQQDLTGRKPGKPVRVLWPKDTPGQE
jgi:hypothetical protein